MTHYLFLPYALWNGVEAHGQLYPYYHKNTRNLMDGVSTDKMDR